jgi:hypothetical protein
MVKTGLRILKYLPVLAAALLSFSASLTAQVVITGTVTDAATGAPLYPATVLDTTSRQATYADSAGRYRIVALGGEVLEFSYLGYYARTYQVPARLSRIIHDEKLTSRTHKLQEVRVTALSPYQQDSLDRINAFGDYLNQPPPPLLDKHSHPEGGFGFTFHPFSYFSRSGRRSRRFHKMYGDFERKAYVYSRYTPALVTRLTGLKGDSLRMFLQRYEPDYRFVRQATNLELWSWIKIRYKSWTMPK